MDYLELIKDKELEFNELYKRMDADKDLRYLTPYVMKDLYGKRLPNIINVTLNDPAVFAANVESSLGSTSQQIVVETDDKKLDTTYIEDFQKAVLDCANERLRKAQRPELNPFLDQHLCQRGSVAVRCLMYLEDDKLIANLTPMDRRYITCDIAEDGLLWAGYRMKRSRGMIEQEYGFTIKDRETEVIDVWDRKQNIVYIDRKPHKAVPHSYGYVPVVIQRVSLGSMLQDSDALKHQGESVFFLIRDLIPELNRLASIAQTLTVDKVARAMMWKTKEGIRATPPAHEDLTGMGAVTAAEIGGGAEPIPIDDLARAAMLLHTMIETRIQRGSLSAVDYGTLEFPLSAVALVELAEGRDQVFLPRLQTKALINQALAEMFTDQISRLGFKIKIGTRGHEKVWDLRKVEGEYTTKYKYYVKSPKIDIARYNIAAQAERWFGDDYIMENIIQVEDPGQARQEKYYDMAEKISPAVMRNRVIKALIERGEDDFEAELMSTEMGMTLKQVLAGQLPQPEPQKAKQPEPIMPMFGGGRASSAKKAAELQQKPGIEEGEK